MREHFGIAHRVPEDLDEHVADNLALLFGIALAGQRGEEFLRGIHRLDLHADAFEVRLHDLGLVFAEESVIDEDRPHLHSGMLEQNG